MNTLTAYDFTQQQEDLQRDGHVAFTTVEGRDIEVLFAVPMLPDEEVYLIERNPVYNEHRFPGAVYRVPADHPLELRMMDHDPRYRREVISARATTHGEYITIYLYDRIGAQTFDWTQIEGHFKIYDSYEAEVAISPNSRRMNADLAQRWGELLLYASAFARHLDRIMRYLANQHDERRRAEHAAWQEKFRRIKEAAPTTDQTTPAPHRFADMIGRRVYNWRLGLGEVTGVDGLEVTVKFDEWEETRAFKRATAKGQLTFLK